MTKNKNLKCVTPGCTGEIGAGSITGLCKRCYSAIYTWTKRPQSDVLKRASALRLYQARMNFMLPTKVRFISSNEKYTPLAVMPGKVKQYRKKTKYKMVSGGG